MKLEMIKNMDKSGYVIYNKNDEILKSKFKNLNLKTIPVDIQSSKNQFYLSGNHVYELNEKIVDLKMFRLKGDHNYFNLITAIKCSSLFDISIKKIKEAIYNFNYVEHRQELFEINKNISFVNDSKATNIESVISAINTFNDPTILLMGGYNKNSKFQLLLPHIKKQVQSNL